jgi:hypothetical protein
MPIAISMRRYGAALIEVHTVEDEDYDEADNQTYTKTTDEIGT